MRLTALLAGLPVTGDLTVDSEVTGIGHDSRSVEPGDLFVTWKGALHDGALFAAQAVERGAVAILADRPRPESFRHGAVPWIECEAPRALLGPLARRVYGAVEDSLTLVGITGTNGKSTVVELVASLFEARGWQAARFGTLGYRFPGLERGSERTTPEASDLYRMLGEATRLGARAVALEVSSHALVQGRVEGLRFDVGVFTNLSQDHLDFHGSLEEYFASKKRLFDQLKPGGVAVVGVEDDYGKRLAAELPHAMTFGSEGRVRPARIELDARGIRGELETPRGKLEFSTGLLGRYNLFNILAVAAVAEVLGLEQEALRSTLERAQPLPGRLEPVDLSQAFPVLVDYAHTPAALEAALRATRELGRRPVVLVFGCGGERDRTKREPMGRIAGELAEIPIATSDNPRGEDPMAILAEIERGLVASGNPRYRVVPDRREAIRRAVAVAAAQDWTVLVAGKGHERVQIIGNQRLPFSDREELLAALEERRGGKAGV